MARHGMSVLLSLANLRCRCLDADGDSFLGVEDLRHWYSVSARFLDTQVVLQGSAPHLVKQRAKPVSTLSRCLPASATGTYALSPPHAGRVPLLTSLRLWQGYDPVSFEALRHQLADALHQPDLPPEFASHVRPFPSWIGWRITALSGLEPR